MVLSRFTASARLRYPSTGAYASRDFKAGPIAIFPGFEAQAQAVINSFNAAGNPDVNVYELQSSTTVNVSQTLTHKPKVALLNDGNPDIHGKVYVAAGLVEGTHYEETTADNLTDTSCFTVATEPHVDFDDPVKVANVRDFVLNGGNFLA